MGGKVRGFLCALAAVWTLQVFVTLGTAAAEAAVQGDLGWLRTQAAEGDTEAWYRLGLVYEEGIGVPPDPVAARAAYGEAARRGHVSAQFRLAQMLSQSGEPADLAEARHWYAEAAAQGLVAAAFNAALFEENGIGGEVDLPAAAVHYEQAARGGIGAAAMQLALLHYAGRLGPADPVVGLAWMMRAAALGLEDAQSMAQDLATGLSAEQVAQAATLAQTL